MEAENIGKLYNKANELFNKAEYQEALKYYFRILSLDTNSSVGYYNIGVIFNLLNELELAVASYKKAIRLDETNIRAIGNLASIYVYSLNDFDMAIKYLDYAIKIAPNDAEAYNIYGNIYLLKEDFKKAQMYFRKAILYDENYFKNHFDMARTYIGLNEKDKAQEELEKCLQLAPDYEPALNLKNSL